jgi:predicted phage tail protein
LIAGSAANGNNTGSQSARTSDAPGGFGGQRGKTRKPFRASAFAGAFSFLEHIMQKTVSIEVADYSDSSLPTNASDLLAFWEAELQKVPAEFRESAEIKRFNASYEGDWDEWRTTLEYSRLETAEEQSEREAKAANAGTRILFGNEQIELWRDGHVVIRMGNIDKPFVVSGDQVFINDALVKHAGVTALSNTLPGYAVKAAVSTAGQAYVAGFGVGLAGDGKCAAHATSVLTARVTGENNEPASDFEKALAEGDAGKILDRLAGTISETALGKELTAQIDKIEKVDSATVQALESRVAAVEGVVAARLAKIDQLQKTVAIQDQIRSAIIRELRPGGMLYRR